MAQSPKYVAVHHSFIGQRGEVHSLLIGTERGTDANGNPFRKGLNVMPGEAVNFATWIYKEETKAAVLAAAKEVDSLAQVKAPRGGAAGITQEYLDNAIATAVAKALAAVSSAQAQAQAAASKQEAPAGPVPGARELRRARRNANAGTGK